MRLYDVALRSLLHDRGKLAASVLGVAFAATLLLVQIGLFVAFLSTSSALVRRIGGDAWVMSKGTEVVDNAELLPAEGRTAVAALPCVRRVRGAVIAVAMMKKPSGALDYVQIVGVDLGHQEPPVPWNLVRGRRADLETLDRVAIDEHDIEKLELPADPMGHGISVGSQTARVAALTRGIRSFALYPYLFSSIDTARHLSSAPPDEAEYWVVELTGPECAPAFFAAAKRLPGLDAHATLDFARMTESYWVFGSGAGSALAFCAIFSLLVGAVIVAQTLYSITKEHEKELATLKAMGGTPGELASFVATQATFLATVGGSLGALLALSLKGVLSRQGIEIALSPLVFGIGASAVASMCALASVPSVRRVLRVEAAEVFR